MLTFEIVCAKIIQNPPKKDGDLMAIEQQTNLSEQEKMKLLEGYCLFDDILFAKCFDGDAASVKLILQIILDKPDLQVLETHAQMLQEDLTNRLNRSVKLDALAADSSGCLYNIEIRRDDSEVEPLRVRYLHSMMDVKFLDESINCEGLPEAYLIFIAKNDVVGHGLAMDEIEAFWEGTNIKIEDGVHTLFLNGAYRDESPLGKLMHDFSCSNPDEMFYDTLASRVNYFKRSKNGISAMSVAMDRLKNIG